MSSSSEDSLRGLSSAVATKPRSDSPSRFQNTIRNNQVNDKGNISERSTDPIPRTGSENLTAMAKSFSDKHKGNLQKMMQASETVVTIEHNHESVGEDKNASKPLGSAVKEDHDDSTTTYSAFSSKVSKLSQSKINKMFNLEKSKCKLMVLYIADMSIS